MLPNQPTRADGSLVALLGRIANRPRESIEGAKVIIGNRIGKGYTVDTALVALNATLRDLEAFSTNFPVDVSNVAHLLHSVVSKIKIDKHDGWEFKGAHWRALLEVLSKVQAGQPVPKIFDAANGKGFFSCEKDLSNNLARLGLCRADFAATMFAVPRLDGEKI